MAIQTIYTGNRILDNFLSNIYKILNQLAQRLDKAALKTDLDNTNKVLEATAHTRLHDLDGTSDHTGITGVEDNFMGIDAVGLPKDSGSKASDFAVSGHNHDHAALTNLNSASYTHLTAANHTDLTDGGVTALHSHTNDHVAATVADTSSVDMSITGQQISAETIGLTDTITFVE